MNEQEVNEKFDNLVKPQSVKPKKEPAKHTKSSLKAVTVGEDNEDSQSP